MINCLIARKFSSLVIAILRLHLTLIRSEFVDLSIQPQPNAATIVGAAASDELGTAGSNLGDINGDDIADIIISAQYADYNGRVNCGTSYVIYGRNRHSNFGSMSLQNWITSPTTGFRIFGAGDSHMSGFSVRGAGDVNGDGIKDIIVGSRGAAAWSKDGAGSATIIYGHNQTSPAFVDIDLLSFVPSPSLGFQVFGAAAGDACGTSVSGAGDVNGDGVDDIIIGSPYSDLFLGDGGVAHVIYGRKKTNPFLANLDLAVVAYD